MTAFARRPLAEEAMYRAIEVRRELGLDLASPLDIYAVCEQRTIPVQFVPINMEGMYVRGRWPRILLSPVRPAVRRAFTCAHELGHHVFGHGFTIDELIEDWRERTAASPEEFLAQTFAGFLLLPPLGVRKAFTIRGWSAPQATPGELFTVACSFGVGYTSLVHHLTYSLRMLPRARADSLLRVPLPRVRRELLGSVSPQPLIVVDAAWQLPTLDVEVGTHILTPPCTQVANDRLAWRADLPNGRLFEATRPGITQVFWIDRDRAIFARISRYQYVGLSKYRHLEDEDEDDDEQDTDG
jgi:hypothetical protein